MCLCQLADHHPPNSDDFVVKESHGVIQLFQKQIIALIMQMFKTLSSLVPFLVAVGWGFPLLPEKLWGRGWPAAMQVPKVCIVYASFAIG